MIAIPDLIKDVNNSNRFRIPNTGTYIIGQRPWLVCKDFPTGKHSPAMALNKALYWTHTNDIPKWLEERYQFDTLQDALDAYNRSVTKVLPANTEVLSIKDEIHGAK